jgi:iron(III) transport system ATP-binding protein
MAPAPDQHPIDLRVEGLQRRFGDVIALAGASLEVRRGELVSILGPSGCGKSTLLQLVAGHLAPDAGRIEIAGRTVSGDGVHVPARDRGVGMVFQDYALFPHLTVLANVAFGADGRTASRNPLARMRARRITRAQAQDVLDRLGIGALASRFPHELSGGQQQRVAIARALAQRPRLLLLDEPFCNLDATTRERVRGEVVQLLRDTGLSCVFVTHDQEEALAASDRVAVMQAGQVVQVDEPVSLYRRPFCVEVAEFLGRTNLLRGHARAGRVRTQVGSFDVPASTNGSVEVLVRPELLDVRANSQGTAVVVGREFRGHDVLYRVQLEGGDLVWAHRPSIEMAAIGDRVDVIALPGSATVATAGQLPAPPSPVAATSLREEPVVAGRTTSSQSGTAEIATRTRAGSAASR